MSVEIKKMETEQDHFQVVDLSDCDVPIGCPFGLDPGEDVIPDHHGSSY